MDKTCVLVVDDEKEIADLVEIYLSNEGYRVLKAGTADEADRLLQEHAVQLVILDIMMPGVDGLTFCREIRKRSNIPVLMLSAKSQDMDKIMGLATGADDYLTKPFNPLELVARVKSLLRRYLYLNPGRQNAGDDDVATVRGLQIDRKGHRVTVYGREVSLTPTEFEILFLLAKNKGIVLSAEEIFEKVWNERYYESNNTVMVHIRKIREKIEEDPGKPEFIKTVWGVGYRIDP
ncbi:MAG TPA: response regulator transcription factor [Firmicutes bacterium]|nr:response regulator transcription factor [Candidatus Fermentithermobacillaceae bacterium]